MVSLVRPVTLFVQVLFPSVALLVAVLVLVGWWLQIPALVQLNPHLAPMQFNTALCFVALSLGVLCRWDWLRRRFCNIPYTLTLGLIRFLLSRLSPPSRRIRDAWPPIPAWVSSSRRWCCCSGPRRPKSGGSSSPLRGRLSVSHSPSPGCSDTLSSWRRYIAGATLLAWPCTRPC
jgi:hypothetical protein